MKEIVSNVTGEVILSYQENGYQQVVDEFKNTSYINIVTYNITTYEWKADLIKVLRKIDKSIPVTLILNIPNRREKYLKRNGEIDYGAVDGAKQNIKYTLEVLERSKFENLTVYFNFENHAKLLITDKLAYIGSQNFSDASKNNYELGILVNNSDKIIEINDRIFNKLKKSSILYSTSEYTIIMKETSQIMSFSLENIRHNIFTIAGDPPYTPEVEVINIDNIYITKKKWENFQVLHEDFGNIVDKLINNYPSEFNKKKAENILDELENLVETVTLVLDEVVVFSRTKEDSMMWEKFYEIDTGDDLDSNLKFSTEYVSEYKRDKFAFIENTGEQLVNIFDDIEHCVNDIIETIEEIKDSMIEKTVYDNIDVIKNYENFSKE